MGRTRWALSVAAASVLVVGACLEAQEIEPQTVTVRIDNMTDTGAYVYYRCGPYTKRISYGGPNEITTLDVPVVKFCVGGDMLITNGEGAWRAPDPGVSEEGYAAVVVCLCGPETSPALYLLTPDMPLPIACGEAMCKARAAEADRVGG